MRQCKPGPFPSCTNGIWSELNHQTSSFYFLMRQRRIPYSLLSKYLGPWEILHSLLFIGDWCLTREDGSFCSPIWNTESRNWEDCVVGIGTCRVHGTSSTQGANAGGVRQKREAAHGFGLQAREYHLCLLIPFLSPLSPPQQMLCAQQTSDNWSWHNSLLILLKMFNRERLVGSVS